MFHRIPVEEWQRVLSMMSIGIFLGVFLINLVRIRRMSRESITRLGNLPLENDDHVQSR